MISFSRIRYLQTEIKVRSTLALRRVQGFNQNMKNPQSFSLLYVCFVGDYIKMSFFQNFYVCHYFSSSHYFIYKQCIKYNLHYCSYSFVEESRTTFLLPFNTASWRRAQVPKCCWVKQPPLFVASEILTAVDLFEGGLKGITGPTSPSF